MTDSVPQAELARNIRARLSAITEQVAAAQLRRGIPRDPVSILAAAKYADDEVLEALVAAGVTQLAENRIEHLEQHHRILGQRAATCTWHFIGRLQSRIAVRIAAQAAVIHTLCSLSAAQRLDRAINANEIHTPELLVQVNIADDPAKDGLRPSELERFLLDLPPSLMVSGLMTMPPFTDDPEQSRGAFSALRDCMETTQNMVSGRHNLHRLSMGTSQDYVVAVEEGATDIRLGAILYAGTLRSHT